MKTKHKILWWLKGFTLIIDGIVILFTFGNYDTEYSMKVNEKIIRKMMKDYRKDKNEHKIF